MQSTQDRNVIPVYIPQVHASFMTGLGIKTGSMEDLALSSGVPAINLNAISAFNAIIAGTGVDIAGNLYNDLNYHDPSAPIGSVIDAMHSMIDNMSGYGSLTTMKDDVSNLQLSTYGMLSMYGIVHTDLWRSAYDVARLKIGSMVQNIASQAAATIASVSSITAATVNAPSVVAPGAGVIPSVVDTVLVSAPSIVPVDSVSLSNSFYLHNLRVADRLQAAINRYAAMADDVNAINTSSFGLGLAWLEQAYADEALSLSVKVEELAAQNAYAVASAATEFNYRKAEKEQDFNNQVANAATNYNYQSTFEFQKFQEGVANAATAYNYQKALDDQKFYDAVAMAATQQNYTAALEAVRNAYATEANRMQFLQSIELACLQSAKETAGGILQAEVQTLIEKAKEQERVVFNLLQEQSKRLAMWLTQAGVWGQTVLNGEQAYSAYVSGEAKLYEAEMMWPLDVSMAFGQLIGLTSGSPRTQSPLSGDEKTWAAVTNVIGTFSSAVGLGLNAAAGGLV